MTNKVALLNKASGFFFFAGFVTTKVLFLPIAITPAIANVISLLFNSIGYAIWYLASHFYPEQKLKKNDWYSFAQSKEQHTFAAMLGLLATILSFAALSNPILFIPVAWLFLGSNLMWTLGEYHKLKNPPEDENYSSSYQNVYLAYALTITGITLIAAINTTLLILFPPLAMPILIATTIIMTGLSAVALELWLDYTCNSYPPKPKNNSYNQIDAHLGDRTKQSKDIDPEPYHGRNPFQSHSVEPPSKEVSPDSQKSPAL